MHGPRRDRHDAFGALPETSLAQPTSGLYINLTLFPQVIMLCSSRQGVTSMKCPKCHFDNPEDTKFCGNCATPLPAVQIRTPADLRKTINEISRELANGTLITAKYRILAKLGAGGLIFDS